MGDRKQRHNRITFQDGWLVAKHRSVFFLWGTKVVCVDGEEEGAPRMQLDQELSVPGRKEGRAQQHSSQGEGRTQLVWTDILRVS